MNNQSIKKEEVDILYDLEEVVNIVKELNVIKKDAIQTQDELVTILENGIKKIEDTIDEATDCIAELHKETEEALYFIKDIKQGIPGEPGKDADETKIIEEVLKRIPKLDEKKLTKTILSQVPVKKADLKIIQERFETDPMSVIEKIMAMPEGSFKLKSTNIDGLDQTISAFKTQLSRGYLHGGGLTSIAHDTTLSGDGTLGNPLSVISSGGTPGGNTTEIQFNDAGTFAGDSSFVWDKVNKRLGIGVTPTYDLELQKSAFTRVLLKSNTDDIYLDLMGNGGDTEFRMSADNNIHTFSINVSTTGATFSYIKGMNFLGDITGDIRFGYDYLGIILIDRTNANSYRLYMEGGVLKTEVI